MYSFVWGSFLPLQTVWTLMKCSLMLHFIWVFTFCQSTPKSTCLGASSIQRVNPYPATIFYVLKISSAFYVCCIYSSTLQTRFDHGSKQYGPWSDCSLGSRLILVHIVCNIGNLRTYAEERANCKRRDWQENG